MSDWVHPDAKDAWHCRTCGQWAGPTQDFARRCEARHGKETVYPVQEAHRLKQVS